MVSGLHTPSTDAMRTPILNELAAILFVGSARRIASREDLTTSQPILPDLPGVTSQDFAGCVVSFPQKNNGSLLFTGFSKRDMVTQFNSHDVHGGTARHQKTLTRSLISQATQGGGADEGCKIQSCSN